MNYVATKQHVYNRDVPPDKFLDELVAWGKDAPDEIFAPNAFSDVYSSVKNSLGPWEGIRHRRGVMLEVMRVLAGFESSWNWKEGRDTTNPTSVTPETIEARRVAGQRKFESFRAGTQRPRSRGSRHA